MKTRVWKRRGFSRRSGKWLPPLARQFRWFAFLLFSFAATPVTAPPALLSDERPLELPPVGGRQLRILSPTTLELTLITTKAPDPARVTQWDFVGPKGEPRLPAASEFVVTAGGRTIPVQRVGFKRRVVYAPLKQRDLRIGNWLYLQLAQPVVDGQKVEVKNPPHALWPAEWAFSATADPLRWSPAIHVNQLGYLPAGPKTAMVGGYLGDLGELPLAGGNQRAAAPSFRLLDAGGSKAVFEGTLRLRPDAGFTFSCYEQVYEADFSGFSAPGEYRLQIPGLGVSFPFKIAESVAAAWARTYALGLYHQRCGTANELPFTRFTHGPCHIAPAEVPTDAFTQARRFLADSTADYTNTARHTAPQLKSFSASLYPFARQGKIDVSGGHHDAGDYSKYTINSAGLIHFLVLAADVFPGVGDLDNLGLPESGDGRGDLLQEAKWEADFLAKMQDTDGGFYFLVYPRARRYENNVLPDAGDPQIVWPKNTAATAAAVAALAQCGSSPQFKRQFPEAAARYLDQARKGWSFLEEAIAKHGRDGAYQKLTHYGNEFRDDDELAWAACELYLATGESKYHHQLTRWFDPADPATRRWGWQRMVASYGCAIRSYAFGARSGRVRPQQLDVNFLTKCENEIIAAAEDQLRRARESAYGTSFPAETKRVRAAGWYFSGDAAFDLAVACQLDFPPLNDPRPRFRAALLSNLNYEAGCNPVNVCYVTGLGWKRPREIVHQYAQNDRRVLPPSGISIGNIQTGFMWLDLYQRELGQLSYPADGAEAAPYPFYDRWGDSFNLSTEFVVLQPARNLATTAWLLAQTGLKAQRDKPPTAGITLQKSPAPGPGDTVTLSVPGAEPRGARIVWEAERQEPSMGAAFPVVRNQAGPHWIEAEALLPDGRLLFAATNWPATPAAGR